MRKIYVPSGGVEDWRKFLAEPDKQWRTGYSAKSLAYSWEEADGFPREVQAVFEESEFEELRDIEPLLVVPEHQVPLPPKNGRSSQNDVFVLAKSMDQLVSITVEGKVSEPFGQTVADWMATPSEGKKERLEFLKEQLGLKGELPSDVRYQLLHRTASAILEAKRFMAQKAIMLVHSFSQEMDWYEDYQEFLKLFNAEASVNKLTRVTDIHGIQLYCGWIKGDQKYIRM